MPVSLAPVRRSLDNTRSVIHAVMKENDMEIRGEFACLSSAWSNIWASLAGPGLDNIKVGKFLVFGSNPSRPAKSLFSPI